LFKYFESYCQIKSEASTDSSLRQFGPFDDFEFIIYTNERMECNSAREEGEIDPLNILSSRSNDKNYITFHETCDRDVFEFFQELISYKDYILELDNLIKRETLMDEQIKERLKYIRKNFKSQGVLDSLNNLQSRTSNINKLVKEFQGCDFSLCEEFLSKVKIFQHQLNEKSFETLIKQEIQETCQTSPPCAKSIYRKFDESLRDWWERSGSVEWLSEDSPAWQSVKQHLTEKIKELSESEVRETKECGLRFKQQHIERLSDAIQENTFLNIVTSTHASILSKVKTYQALVSLGYRNSLFINLKTLVSRRKEVLKLWPCKWSAVLVINCEEDSESVDDNMIDTLVDSLHRYQQKVILLSPRGHENLASRLREKFGNVCKDYEDTCKFLDFDKDSQKQILGKNVDFQGTEVALEKLVGTNPPEFITSEIDCNVISLLLGRGQKLCVGRKLCDPPKYYVQRLLEHRIYLKNDILQTTDNTFKFAVSGLQADQLIEYLPPGEKIYEYVFNERERNYSFKIVASCSKPRLGVNSRTTKTHHIGWESSKQEDVRYVVLKKRHPERGFRKLKALFTNIHWIHMEGGSFVWRESSCNIDIIRRYIDNTKYKKYGVKRLMKHNDKTMLVVAEPGMGKSTFLSYMEREIKQCERVVWVLRINLHEHTRAFENTDFKIGDIDKCSTFLCNAAHSPEQDALNLVKIIFLQALKTTGNMVILLDGFDEISPEYSRKVEVLIREVTERTPSKIWVSSRPSCRLKLQEIMTKFAFTLQPFTRRNQIDFLEEFWNKSIEGFKPESLRTFAEELLALSSKNFGDKDGQFTGIPLQTMMVGEAFLEEAKKHCSSGTINLPVKFNLLALFKKFTEKKFDIYFSEKNKIDCSKPQAKRDKKLYVKKHMISALMSFFSPYKLKRHLKVGNEKYLKQIKKFLKSGEAEQFGIIVEFTKGKPRFIHRCFAEYFAAMWFSENFTKCENFISSNFFNPAYELIRNIFDRMLAEESELHGAVLNNDIVAVSEFLKNKKDLNTLDKGGRTALHLAASYNGRITQILLSVPRVNISKADRVLKWTPLTYAKRTKSWIAMDMLLQNGGNTKDIVLTRHNIYQQEWGQACLWECAKEGYKILLNSMLDSGIYVNAVVRVREHLHGKCTLLHVASFYGIVEVARLLGEKTLTVMFVTPITTLLFISLLSLVVWILSSCY
jgi:ankyrin repeat protein